MKFAIAELAAHHDRSDQSDSAQALGFYAVNLVLFLTLDRARRAQLLGSAQRGAAH